MFLDLLKFTWPVNVYVKGIKTASRIRLQCTQKTPDFLSSGLFVQQILERDKEMKRIFLERQITLPVHQLNKICPYAMVIGSICEKVHKNSQRFFTSVDVLLFNSKSDYKIPMAKVWLWVWHCTAWETISHTFINWAPLIEGLPKMFRRCSQKFQWLSEGHFNIFGHCANWFVGCVNRIIFH